MTEEIKFDGVADLTPTNPNKLSTDLGLTKFQAEILDFFYSKCYHHLITSEAFSEIPHERVALDRFMAATGFIKNIIGASLIAQDQGTKELFEKMATAFILERDKTAQEMLGGLMAEADPELIEKERNKHFKLDGEAMTVINFALSRGFAELLNTNNIPALNLLTAEHLEQLKSEAIKNSHSNHHVGLGRRDE